MFFKYKNSVLQILFRFVERFCLKLVNNGPAKFHKIKAKKTLLLMFFKFM